MRGLITVTRSTYEDAYPNLERVLSFLSPFELQHYLTLIVKINMCDMRSPETGTTTHSLFLNGVLHYLREYFENLKIYVVESDATVALVDKFIQRLGLDYPSDFMSSLQTWLESSPAFDVIYNNPHFQV